MTKIPGGGLDRRLPDMTDIFLTQPPFFFKERGILLIVSFSRLKCDSRQSHGILGVPAITE